MGKSKYDRGNGIHGVPMWRLAGFALNNTATNLYLCLMNLVAYYLTGFVGVLVVTASSFAMMMRIWDGVTDPIIGFVVDKTDGKFGKNRPFMVIGNVILLVTSFVLFHITHLLPDNTAIRFAFFIVIAAIYYVGYTFQCVVTKSAQTCITNDPKQRPIFSVFDASYNVVMFIGFQMYTASLVGKYGTFYDAGLFHEVWLTVAVLSAVFTAIAVFCIAPKDKREYFGTGQAVKLKLKDYWDTLKHNRAIQMLVLAASTDKLAGTARTGAVTTVMFGIVAGNFMLSGTLQGFTAIPVLILSILCISTMATRLGQRKAMLIGSIGGIISNGLLVLLWWFGDATTMSGADGQIVFGFFTIAYILLSIVAGGFQGISGNIVIPMTADCADYEVYRTGRYVPGMMGTLFSFVDKIISSLAPMIAGMMFAVIGFKEVLPDVSTPYSTSLHFTGIFLMYGLIIIGLICNMVALKFYPLTKEKMAEIQEEIAALKAKAAGKQAS